LFFDLLDVRTTREKMPLPAPQERSRQRTRTEALGKATVVIAEYVVGRPTRIRTTTLRILCRDDDETKTVLAIPLVKRLPLRNRLHTWLAPRCVKLEHEELHARSLQPRVDIQTVACPTRRGNDHAQGEDKQGRAQLTASEAKRHASILSQVA